MVCGVGHGDNDLKTASMLLSTYAKLQTPIFLRSLKVLFIYSKFLDSRWLFHTIKFFFLLYII